MIGFYTLHLISRGIYPLVFTLLVQARTAFIFISKECRSGSIHRLKAEWLYIFKTLAFLISTPSDDFACLSVSSYKQKGTTNITGSSALDLQLDCYSFRNGVLEPVVEQSTHWGVLNNSYVHTIILSRAWLRFGEITLSCTLRKPAMRTWGYCKYWLNTRALRLVMEHSQPGLVAVVVSRAWPEIRVMPSSTSSTRINSAMEAWEYFKSFLFSWRYTLSAPSVECDYLSFM